jgi:hypothetical protein
MIFEMVANRSDPHPTRLRRATFSRKREKE